MTVDQIRSLGPALSRYLDEFADCFKSSQTQEHLKHYVTGQLSDLPRKSVEPMANLAAVPPRTLQEFLSLSDWDQQLLRTRLQQLVAKDHAGPNAIGILDASGYPKKGTQSACVHRQYCGATGKLDNCVMGVHLAYASWDNDFAVMLDSELFLPQAWSEDADRRQAAGIPAELSYRPKYEMGLEQLRRARSNGIGFKWITADQEYGGNGIFIAGLESMKQHFVLETKANLVGWLHPPAKRQSGGLPRRHQSREQGGGSTIENLCGHSGIFTSQRWKRFHIKDTGKGPLVWEAKSALWWTEREGKLTGPYRLVVARNVLDPEQVKYFLSDCTNVPLRVTLHVGFSRWPVERCLEDSKTELGMDQFECRKYGAILRHLLVTQVSLLFLARQCLRLRGEKGGRECLPGSHRCRGVAGRIAAVPEQPRSATGARRPVDSADPEGQRRGHAFAQQSPPPGAARNRHSGRTPDLLPAAVISVIAL
jgi:SRSO17 transposase